MGTAPVRTPPPLNIRQLTGLILACYHHVFATLPGRLRHNPAGAALVLSQALRDAHLRVDLRVQPLPVELRINTQAVLQVVAPGQLREPYLSRVWARLRSEEWAAGLLVSFETARPTYRRWLREGRSITARQEEII